MAFSTWLTFFAAAWAISFSPGAGAVAALSCGLKHGLLRTYWNIAGLISGIMFQLLIVGIGLGALLATYEMAFAVVKWTGVAYLIYLGVRQWRGSTGPVAADPVASHDSARDLFVNGFLINASNPKGTVFLLAVVPQFLDTANALTPQYLAIAATLALTDTVAMGVYAALAAKVLRLLRSPAHIRWMNRIFGGLFIVAGLALATFKRAAP